MLLRPAVCAARILLLLGLLSCGHAQIRVVDLPGKSPVVNFRIVFTTGAEVDPEDKPGLAWLTAALLAHGGICTAQVDQEMSTFTGSTPADRLPQYYRLLRGALLYPDWDPSTFQQVKDEAIRARENLTPAAGAELADQVLYREIFRGTPYGHFTAGTVSSLRKITLADVQQFYRMQYSQSNVILGLTGSYSDSFVENMRKDFRKLPDGAGFRPRPKPAALIESTRAVIVRHDTPSVSWSAGFPISVTRSALDYPALLVAALSLQQSGLQACIEYSPSGQSCAAPPANLARRYQIFRISLPPTDPAGAWDSFEHALAQLNRLMENGIAEDVFQRVRDSLTQTIGALGHARDLQLALAIDSAYYRMPRYGEYLKTALEHLTAGDVQRVARNHLRTTRMVMVAVAADAAALQQQLTATGTSGSEKWPPRLHAGDIQVLAAGDVFQ